MALKNIFLKNPDIVLLQEVEQDFFSVRRYPKVDKLMDRYYVYPKNNKYMGTRVLVNKTGNLCPLIKPMKVEKYI